MAASRSKVKFTKRNWLSVDSVFMDELNAVSCGGGVGVVGGGGGDGCGDTLCEACAPCSKWSVNRLLLEIGCRIGADENCENRLFGFLGGRNKSMRASNSGHMFSTTITFKNVIAASRGFENSADARRTLRVSKAER